MADAIPTPPGQTAPQAQSTVVVQKPMTEWEALKEAGWWGRFDWIMLGLIGALWVTTGFYFLFSTPRPEGSPRLLLFAVVLLLNVSLKLVWAIAASFRCAYFILKAHADIALMPNNAARIAAAFLAGHK